MVEEKGFLQKICSDINGKSECLLASMYKQMQGFCVASRGRNPNNPKSREIGLETEQMLEPRLDGKTNCLTSVQKDNLYYENERIRCFTEIECEKLQTMKSGYTNHVSTTQRLKMIGNGWTIDVISHIFSYLDK